MNITTGRISKAQRVVVYGPEGIGKSTFASRFPEPLFIDTEGSTNEMTTVRRFDKPTSWSMLLEEVKYVKQNPSVCRTLVVDTADWAEKLCKEDFCARKQISGIEDIGYGKGYVYVSEEFGKLLNLLTEIYEMGIHVVMTAHAAMRKFEQPDEMGSYDRWELKLEKKDAPLLKEWADIILFANYKTIVINVDGQGAQKGKNKAQGGQRVMYTTHHTCWDAKNRHDLAEELPFDYSAVAHIFERGAAPAVTQPYAAPSVMTVNPVQESRPADTPVNIPVDIPAANPANVPASNPVNIQTSDPANIPVAEAAPPDPVKELEPPVTADLPPAIPQKVQDLIRNTTDMVITVQDIQSVVEEKGYYPKGTPVENYDPAFIDGVIVGAWNQVKKCIMDKKLKANGGWMDIPEGMKKDLPFGN